MGVDILGIDILDRQTDKYFISRSGQTIDIEQNLQIQLQIETWHTIDKYGEYVQ